MRKTLIIGFLIFLSVSGFGQQSNESRDVSDWSLVYANDENGKILEGDLAKLIDAIRNGKAIRIGWTFENASNKNIKVEHFADAKFITILSNADDTVVFAQIDPIVGQTPSLKDKFVTLQENVEWAFSASTLGNNDSMFLNKKTGKILDHKPWKAGIKWFAKIR